MKFAARDGTAARTLAISTPARRVAHPPAVPSAPDGRAGQSGDGGLSAHDGRSPRQRPTTVAYSKGHGIFSPGRGAGLIYIVRSGCVRLYKVLPDGRSINLGLLGPNTIFAQEDGHDGLATGAHAEALVDSTLSIVEADDLAALIADSPELAAAVVAGMTRRLTELQTLVEHLLVRDTTVRLATTLHGLAGRFGRPVADGMTAIGIPLTHQTLANMIGSNRVTVTRRLLELQESRLVRSLGRNALAVDREKLLAYVQDAGKGTDRRDDGAAPLRDNA